MKKCLIFTALLSLLTCCIEKRRTPCDCCENVYLNIDDALKCIDKNPRKTSNDDRLFLIAITDSKNQSWNLIKDRDIISNAKRNYLLIVANKSEISSHEKATQEIQDLIKKYDEEESYFIVANQAMYPFADWGENESKNEIISALQIGSGP
ncbi:hypothetical protein ABN763_10065 [Spongiivirga sp. MCCC 1A20706]|uniref:hypothetical protein n=1 Tax=Spongiivirga sp. MCCC 1A20706 TaxID=3160963 RepID=UPI003977DC91